MAGTLPRLVTPSVDTRPVAPGYLDPAARPDAATGHAVQGLGAELGDIAVKEKLKADAFAAADLDTKFAKEASDLLYNGQSGFLMQEGDAALDTAPVKEAIAKLRTKYEGLAKNEVQRRAFTSRADDREFMFRNEIERHSGVQRKKYYTDKTNGTASETLTQIGINPAADNVEAQLRIAKRTLVLHWSENEHLPAEKITANWKQFEAVAIGKALETYQARDLGTAGLAYLNAPGIRERLGDTAAEWERKLRPIADKEQGSAIAQTVYEEAAAMNEAAPDEWAWGRLTEVAEKNHLSTEVRGKAEDLLRARLNDHATARNRGGAALLDNAQAHWIRGNHDLSAVPESLKQRLIDRGEWHKLETADKAWKDANSPEHTPPTLEQRRAMAEFMLDLSNNPHKFDNWNEKDFFFHVGWKLHPNDMEQVAGMLARSQGRPDKLKEGLNPIMALYHRLGGSAGAFPDMFDQANPDNRDMTKWGQEDVDSYYAGAQKIEEWLANWHKADHQTPTPSLKEYQEFVETLVATGKDPDKGWWGSKSTRLRSEIAGHEFIPDPAKMPYSVKQEIIQKYTKQFGTAPLPEIVNQIYINAYSIKKQKAPMTTPRSMR